MVKKAEKTTTRILSAGSNMKTQTFQAVDESVIPESPPAVTLLPLNFLKQFKVLPIDDSGDHLVVLFANPYDYHTREIVRTSYEKPLKILHAPEALVSNTIYAWYEANREMSGQEDEEGFELGRDDDLWNDTEQLRDMASEAPVIRLVNHIISRALDLGASDVHVEPKRHNVAVRYRIDGVLQDQEPIANKYQAAIISRIKLMANMDIAERRLPLDGRTKIKLGRKEVDIRVSSVPVQFGESLVLRLLLQDDQQLNLSSLGFPRVISDQFMRLVSQPYGMFLVTGPTGSGKTTTLYSVINEINSPEKKIVTAEDPVEYQIANVNQVQIKQSIGLTYASALRSFLRHDPDIILIGEIRDSETAEIAIQASLTGHMVFSTLHTNDAAGAVNRLADMGVENYLLASSLVGVLAQRLVRRICPHCREKITLTQIQKQAIAHNLEISVDLIDDTTTGAKGCSSCFGTGYAGRTGLYELLVVDDDIQRMIVENAARSHIVRKAAEKGMKTLRYDGLEKVKQGITTFDEILRITR
jgi:general secretion pathway protein E